MICPFIEQERFDPTLCHRKGLIQTCLNMTGLSAEGRPGGGCTRETESRRVFSSAPLPWRGEASRSFPKNPTNPGAKRGSSICTFCLKIAGRKSREVRCGLAVIVTTTFPLLGQSYARGTGKGVLLWEKLHRSKHLAHGLFWDPRP